MNDNIAEQIERTAWNSLALTCGRPAMYRQGEREVFVRAVPCLKDANAFTFAGFPMFEKSQVFEVARAELDGMTPATGDMLIVGDTVYTVRAGGTIFSRNFRRRGSMPLCQML